MEKAVISDCGQYRYVLRRELKTPQRWVKPCLFIMLNPSTADAEVDDPTIKKCIKFAEREGCTHLTVVNLFALRSTDPSKLIEHKDPEGPCNGGWIVSELEKNRFGPVICAWGSHKAVKTHSESIGNLIQIIRGEGCTPLCFKVNKDGNPKHPLYVPNDSELIEYKLTTPANSGN